MMEGVEGLEFSNPSNYRVVVLPFVRLSVFYPPIWKHSECGPSIVSTSLAFSLSSDASGKPQLPLLISLAQGLIPDSVLRPWPFPPYSQCISARNMFSERRRYQLSAVC
jgi:hypothetical protein